MSAIEIHDIDEAKQKLSEAINILDALSVYSISHQVPRDQLLDSDVFRRLQELFSVPSSSSSQTVESRKGKNRPAPSESPTTYPLLQQTEGLSQHEIRTLSPYCYRIEASTDFEDVLNGLKAYCKMMNAQSLANKGELLDSILCSGLSETVRSSVAKVLDVIGSLAIWHIRDIEARTLATKRGHAGITKEDKSNATTKMWEYLCDYNSSVNRANLDQRIFAGIRWNRFLGNKKLGTIVAVYSLPPSLKSHFVKLANILNGIPGILDRAERATPCVKMLLELSLSPWSESKKRKLSIHGEGEPNPKRQLSVNINTQPRLVAATMTQPQQPSIIQGEHSQMLSQVASHQYNPPHPIGSGSACTMQNSVNESREEDPMNPPQEPETVQQGIDQITTTFPSPEFDDLWTSSFPMNDFAMFDDMWNASQIFTIPDVNINSTTTR